ncbi:MAG TPA: SBBP repeat-containing protein, partial [Spirochaetia bacterium]
TDPSGNVYVVGEVTESGTYYFGSNSYPLSVPVASGYKPVILKYDSSGAVQWGKTCSAGVSSAEGDLWAVAVDSSGCIYAAGSIAGTTTCDFGNGQTATGTGSTNVVLVKYDSAGSAQWARTMSSTSSASAIFYSVDIDGQGNVCAVGHVQGTSTYDFGNGATATGVWSGSNAVVVKYDSSGNAQWACTLAAGSSVGACFYGVAIDSGGNVYAAGNMSAGTVNFGNDVSASATGASGLLVKYSSSGAAQWARVGSDYFQSVVVDSSGDIIVVGGTIGKYSPAGVAQWSSAAFTGGYSAVAVAANGDIYAAEVINGTYTISFGGSAFVAGTCTGVNVVVTKYDQDGVPRWAQSTTVGADNSYYNSIAVDSSGNLYVVGNMCGASTYTFGNGVSTSGSSTAGSNSLLVMY